jgi:hypothetical protein
MFIFTYSKDNFPNCICEQNCPKPRTTFASREWRFAGTGRIILHYLLEADEQVRAAGAQRILRFMTPKSNSLNICADEEKKEEEKSATPTQT